jgi:Tetratricopeptide repeat
MFRRFRSAHTSSEVVSLPHPFAWAITTLLLAVLSAAVIAPGFLGLSGLLPAHLQTLLATEPAPEATNILGGVLFVAGLLTLRFTVLATLARRPGTIEVFAPSEAEPTADVDRGGVLAEFRRVLTEMSLPTPQSIPTSPHDDGFLNGIGTVAESPGNWLATAANIVKTLLQVRYAYRVSFQIRHRTGSREPCGITLHIIMSPSNRGSITTIWSDDWDDAAERAAHWVGAFILPRSRLSVRPPWNAWHGFEMPAEMFHHSQSARRCVADRRYEQAIGHYYDALAIDPQNPYLRIELAQALEQIGLPMDALAAYADVVAVECWYDRRLWRRLRRLLSDEPGAVPLSRPGRRPNGRDALLIARFRLVCRLSSAPQLTEQWQQSVAVRSVPGNGFNVERDLQRVTLHRRLTVWLRPYYAHYLADMGFSDPPSFEKFSENNLMMRHFLHFVGQAEALHLVDDYRWSRGRRRPGMPVTQTALRILQVWAPLYLQSAEVAARDQLAGLGWRRSDPRPWPPDPADLDRRLHRELRRKPARLHVWQEHYNAACTIAVAMGGSNEQPGSEEDRAKYRTKLSFRAVRHLERAVSATDSGLVASYAQWLTVGDDDLWYLRSTPAFVDFLERYLPSPVRRVPRPHRLVVLVMSFHTMSLLSQFAAARVTFFGGHLASGPADALADELGRERDLRRIVQRYVQQDRDWSSRLNLIRAAEAFCRRRHLPSLESALPLFHDDPAARGYATTLVEWQTANQPESQNQPLSEDWFASSYYRSIIDKRRTHHGPLLEIIERFQRNSVVAVDPAREAYELWKTLADYMAAAIAYTPSAHEVPATAPVEG